MRMSSRAVLCVASLPLALTCGCGGMYSTAIVYAPKAAAPSAGGPAVTLGVEDRRPVKKGGDDPRRVGTIRALAGNGAGMREVAPDAVPKAVEKATSDGLAAAGIASASGQPSELTVSIDRFWMDGYASYTAEIEATIALRREGTEIWKRTVVAQATGEQGMGSPSSFFNRVWSWALERYAEEVSKAVREPGFATASGFALPVPAGVATGGTGAPPPAGPVGGSASSPGSAKGLGLSVGGEFGLTDSKRNWLFEVSARQAMKDAGIPEVHKGFPQIAVRYSLSLSTEDGGRTTVATIATRVTLDSGNGEVLWQDQFRTKGTFATPTGKNANDLRDVEIGRVADDDWKPELVKRLKSQGLAAAREVRKP